MLSKNGTRQVNEDSIGMKKRHGEYCFIVADGLGGHGCGDIASGLGVETSLNIFQKNGMKAGILEQCFVQSQNEVLKKQASDTLYQKMKTTEVILFMNKHGVIQGGHIGDSRLYYFADNKLVSQTFDHSVPQRLVQAGLITRDEIRGHADRNRLLKAIGGEWEKNKEPYECSGFIQIKPNSAFLLCTDGFWELIEESDMVRLWNDNKDVDMWLKKMEEIVVVNGRGKNMDNYSAIAIMVK